MMIIYHRGRHGTINSLTYKENSLEAFALAVQEGAEMVEFDVWNDLRVAHDPGANTNAPTLTQVLDLINARCAVNIEVKGPEAADVVAEEVERRLASGKWESEQFVLSSFHHQTASDLKGRLWMCRVGAIFDCVPLPGCVGFLAGKVDQVHIEKANMEMDRQFYGLLRTELEGYNMPIWVWTVNTQEEYGRAVQYGAKAIFTDRPDLFRP